MQICTSPLPRAFAFFCASLQIEMGIGVTILWIILLWGLFSEWWLEFFDWCTNRGLTRNGVLLSSSFVSMDAGIVSSSSRCVEILCIRSWFLSPLLYLQFRLPDKSRRCSAYIDLVFAQDLFRVCAAVLLCKHGPLCSVLHCNWGVLAMLDACMLVARCFVVALSLVASNIHSTFLLLGLLSTPLHNSIMFCQINSKSQWFGLDSFCWYTIDTVPVYHISRFVKKNMPKTVQQNQPPLLPHHCHCSQKEEEEVATCERSKGGAELSILVEI